MTVDSKKGYVGIDLDKNGGEVTAAIVEAIRQDNQGVELNDFNVYVKVKAPGQMVIRRETVEEKLGRDWSMDELHIFMSSCFGFVEDWDEDHLLIRWNNAE